MTKEEAISLLRRYRREETYAPSINLLGWKKVTYDFKRSVYERYLILELIRRIKESNCLPTVIVQSFYSFMDEMIGDSDHSRTWEFASYMEMCMKDILIYFQRDHMNKRRRMNHEQNRLAGSAGQRFENRQTEES